MRRRYLMMVLAILLQACAGMPFEDVLFPPTSTLAPTVTATVTFTPMDTPTASITPTITSSPTIVHIPTWDPNQPTATVIPMPMFIGKDTVTPYITSTPTRPGPGFLSVQISEKRILRREFIGEVASRTGPRSSHKWKTLKMYLV
jgi:hypothetical protein